MSHAPDLRQPANRSPRLLLPLVHGADTRRRGVVGEPLQRGYCLGFAGTRTSGGHRFLDPEFCPHVDELEGRGYRSLVHFTLTGLPRRYETHVPSVRAALRQIQALARRLGPDRVLWRYDPILISEQSDWGFHRRNFASLVRDLGGATRQCSISFVEIYGKVRRNFQKHGLPLPQTELEERRRLTAELGSLGAAQGIAVRACCNDELLGEWVQKARCVDRDQVLRIWPELSFVAAPAPTREECGCSRSYDVGAYDTCLHGCIYCYATRDRETARSRKGRHDPDCATLLPAAGSPR